MYAVRAVLVSQYLQSCSTVGCSMQMRKSATVKAPIQRVTFSEITKKAVLRAMQNPRAIDTDLVRAYSARIATDYLLGYSLSPLLWRKLRGAKSAGRVQSVALRLVCDREEEREAHASITFYSVTAFLDGQPSPGWVRTLAGCYVNFCHHQNIYFQNIKLL
jgi:DNA topoisomerase IA